MRPLKISSPKNNKSNRRRPASSGQRRNRTNFIPQPQLPRPLVSYPAESKHYDLVLPTVAGSFSTAGVLVDLLSSIAQGNDTSNREGRAIYLTEVSLSGVLSGGQSNTAADDNHNVVRMVIFRGDPGLSVATATGSWPINVPADVRFFPGAARVLHDRIIALPSPGRDSTGYLPATRNVKLRLPLNQRILFTGAAAGTVSSTTIYVYFVSDSNLAPHPGFIQGEIVSTFADL